MSTTAHFFIEIKDENGKWNMLKIFHPFKQETHSVEYVDGSVVTTYTTPDETTISGKELTLENIITQQGHIRDMVSSHSFDTCSFAGRGLPEDISEDVKMWFDKELEKVQKKKDTYLNQKWWWDESYATLSEFYEEFDKLFNKWKQTLVETFTKKNTICSTNKKLDDILEYLQKGKITKNSHKSDDEDLEADVEESIEYYMNDALYDIMNTWAFCRTISDIASEYGDCYLYDNVRLIIFLA